MLLTQTLVAVLISFTNLFEPGMPFSRPTNYPANVYGLALSNSRSYTKCGENLTPDINTQIRVNALASDPQGDVFSYNYYVTAGKVVDGKTSTEKPQLFGFMPDQFGVKGSRVTWDLTGVTPGVYTITAGVDDGCGVCGWTVTKKVTVLGCDESKQYKNASACPVELKFFLITKALLKVAESDFWQLHQIYIGQLTNTIGRFRAVKLNLAKDQIWSKWRSHESQ